MHVAPMVLLELGAEAAWGEVRLVDAESQGQGVWAEVVGRRAEEAWGSAGGSFVEEGRERKSVMRGPGEREPDGQQRSARLDALLAFKRPGGLWGALVLLLRVGCACTHVRMQLFVLSRVRAF